VWNREPRLIHQDQLRAAARQKQTPRRINRRRCCWRGYAAGGRLEGSWRPFESEGKRSWHNYRNWNKDAAYTIIPKIDGQLNRFYFELLANIKDKSGNNVGYCVVELLPGVYNETNARAVLARVK
jgi:hypothetical protein